MKMKKKMAVAAAALVLSLTAVMFTAQAAYTDVSGSYAETAINALVDKGALSGEGTFNGQQQATRGFVAEMLVKSLGLDVSNPPATPSFTDVPVSHPEFAYIEAAKAAGIVSGDSQGGTFRPDATINRAEVAKMVIKTNKFEEDASGSTFSDVPGNQWYHGYVESAYKHGVITGYKNANGDSTGKFGPADNVIRQDVTLMVYRGSNPEAAVIPVVDNPEKVIPEGNDAFNSDATYTGPFPAPAGMVLTGTYGKDTFKAPTGPGPFKFNIQTGWAKPVACLDSTRKVIGSKGGQYDAGYYAGYDVGVADRTAIPQIDYDDTPTGSSDQYYGEGFKVGYERGYHDQSSYWGEVFCPGHDVDTSTYNSDGWSRYSGSDLFEKLPYLKAVFGPANPYGGITNSSQSILGNDSKSMVFDEINNPFSDVSYNKNLGSVNISRIDMSDSELDASEKAQTNTQLAQAFYDIVKSDLANKIKNGCTPTDPLIEDATYGSNTFTQLSYIISCPAYSSASESRWNFVAYAFKRSDDGKRMLTLYFNDPESVKAKGQSKVDDTKLPSVDFMKQFLKGVQYNN